MGGIATQAVGKIVDDEDRRLTLTPEAVLFFARDGVFFDIPPEVISDKSKANLLGKGLVCAQVTWFFTQLLTRVAAEYPLALIEIHTVVHVVCALSMYVLWWKVSSESSNTDIYISLIYICEEATGYLRTSHSRYICRSSRYINHHGLFSQVWIALNAP